MNTGQAIPYVHIECSNALMLYQEKKRPKVSHESILLVLQWRELILSCHIRCISGIICAVVLSTLVQSSPSVVTVFDQIRDSYVYIVICVIASL